MRKVAVFLKNPSVWQSLIDEYFSEVTFEKLPAKETPIQNADLVFLEAALCQPTLIQKVRVARSLNPKLRVFGLGQIPQDAGLFDYIFSEQTDLLDFTKKVSEKIPLADSARLLITDDDPEILSMVSDYFEGRHSPAFEVVRATNGREAWDSIQKKQPDAMILDIKMPLMTGSELYCKLQKQNQKIPTVIFFDAIAAGDLDMIKKAGKPVIVEKGYRESSLAYLMATVKKLIYFADC